MNELEIYKKYVDLMYYTLNLILKYPKAERYLLVSRINTVMYNGQENILYAGKDFNKFNKLKYLNSLDVNLTLLKSYIRISYRYKYISIKNYETWSFKITEICNMLGSWIKICQKR
ncbi:MAG: diversity-generating retroelement protein Avd [Clostridia bacterium]